MPGLGKEVDDAFEGLIGIDRVQSGEAQVAGVSKGDGCLHSFTVADLPDEDHVRCLTHSVLEGVLKRMRIETDFTLVDDCLLMAVDELDRIFDTHNMSRGAA